METRKSVCGINIEALPMYNQGKKPKRLSYQGPTAMAMCSVKNDQRFIFLVDTEDIPENALLYKKY